ncbi:MAG: hypothetical protein N2662_06485, partial [Bacteroidales bacterium]|nr:hypothetical protein [Bacteroidales bacterium]
MRPLKHFKKLGFLFMIQFITLNSVAQCPDGTNSWFVIDSIDRDAKVVYYTVYSNVAADADVNYSISGTSYYYSGTKYYNFASDSTNIFRDTLNYLGEPYIYFSIIFNKPSECASSYYAYENIDFNCNHSAYVSLSSACESDFNKKVPINYYFNVSSGDTIITLVKDRFGAIIDSFASSNYYYNRTIIFNKVGIDTIYVTFVGQYCTRTQKLGVVVSDACSNFGCSADLTMSHVTGNKYKITVNHPNANFYSWSYGTTYGPTQQKDTTSNSIILDMIDNVVYYLWVAPVDTNQFCYTNVQKQFSSTPCFVQFDDPYIYGSTVNFYIYGLNPDKTYKLYFGDGEDSILNITASNPYASISYNYSNITKDYQAVLVVLDQNDTCNLISKTISFKECYANFNYSANSNDPQNVGFYVNSFSYSTTKRKLVLDFGDGKQEIKNFVSWTPPISHRYSKPGVYEVSLFVEFYNDSNELVCTDLVKK